MKVENTKAQMRKGILEYCILTVLSKKEAYPSEIITDLKAANAGLLQYNWVESASGPPRKYYSLTELGKEFNLELKHTWNELYTAVNLISKK